MKTFRGKRTRIIIVASIVLIVGIILAVHRQAAGKMAMKTAVVTRGTVTTTVSATGVLEPHTTVEVKSNVGGTLQ